MPADYYSDAPEAPAAPGKEAALDGGDGGSTALLPKSILAGKEFKPGDEIVLRIDAIHDDEVAVSYASEKGGEEAQPEGGEAPQEAAAPPDGMTSMME